MEDKLACLLEGLWSAGINLCKSVESVGDKNNYPWETKIIIRVGD